MTSTITKDTREEGTYVGALLRGIGFIMFVTSVIVGLVLCANSRPLAGFQVFTTGLVGASVAYGVGLLLKIAVERD